jgi:hypothetical protein
MCLSPRKLDRQPCWVACLLVCVSGGGGGGEDICIISWFIAQICIGHSITVMMMSALYVLVLYIVQHSEIHTGLYCTFVQFILVKVLVNAYVRFPQQMAKINGMQ